MASPPEPGKILAVILGASTWPGCKALSRQAAEAQALTAAPRVGGRQFTAAEVFTRSHERLRRVVDRLLGGNPAAENPPRLLDLFDGGDVNAISQKEIFSHFRAFLTNQVGTPTDLWVFFIGHGHFENGQTYLLTRDGDQSNLTGSTLTFRSIDDQIWKEVPGGHKLRHFYFINACHAAGFGAGGPKFPFDAPDPHAADGYPSRGAAGLFSCRADRSEETELPGAGVTAFVAALEWALTHHPDPADGERFTLDALARAMGQRISGWNRTADRPIARVLRSHDAGPPSSPHPLTHELPLLPNPAAVRRGCLLVSDATAANASRLIQLRRTAQQLHRELENPPASLVQLTAGGTVADADAFREAVLAVAASDYAIIDLTGFEPAVMLLLGLRAVVRRGVTVCVTFAGPEPAPLPFYLHDIAWVNAEQEPDDFEAAVLTRLRAGFEAIRTEPNRYADLPVYDAVRRSSEPDQLVGLRQQLLVLRSYGQEREWRLFRSRARNVLGGSDGPWRQFCVNRVLDLPSGRLNTWSAFAAIRQARLCVVDWSDWRPNVFFELGVRLAVNPNAALSLIGGGSVPSADNPEHAQRRRLCSLFRPVPYDRDFVDPHSPLEHELPNLIRTVENSRRRPPDLLWAVHQLVWDTVHPRQATELQDVPQLLLEAARPFVILPGEGSAHDSPYPDAHALRQLAPKVACERLLAAWLYLRHRVGLDAVRADDRLRRLVREMAADLIRLNSDYECGIDPVVVGEVRAVLTDLTGGAP